MKLQKETEFKHPIIPKKYKIPKYLDDTDK